MSVWNTQRNSEEVDYAAGVESTEFRLTTATVFHQGGNYKVVTATLG